MKAYTYSKYGSPDVLEIKDIQKPIPNDDEVLINVKETIVTPTEIASRKGDPFIIRFFTGLLKPKIILGTDFAGIIVEVGKNVTKFEIGDKVFGSSNIKFGAYSEFISLPENGIIGKIPDSLNYRDVAGTCDAGMTALTFLRETANIQKGQTILINGASGSVGSFAVQLAKYYGAEVTGVCSTKNITFVKSLGADHTIDYLKEDFTNKENRYDIIFDAVGKSNYSICKNVLKPNGLYLTTVLSTDILIQMLKTKVFSKKKAIFVATGLTQNNDKLNDLKKLLELGKIKSITDREYTFEEMVKAHIYVETGHKTGQVVITV